MTESMALHVGMEGETQWVTVTGKVFHKGRGEALVRLAESCRPTVIDLTGCAHITITTIQGLEMADAVFIAREN